MIFTLSSIFDEFCKQLSGKLRWSRSKAEWTDAIFDFFHDLNEKQHKPLKEEREHMNIDYLWRDVEYFPYQSIKLAVEHENKFDLNEFLDSEIQHLLDIKAECKIAITYPQLGDENKLIREVTERIKQYSQKLSPFEDYLLILGFATSKEKKRAIRFRGYLLDREGKITEPPKDRTIFQSA